MRVVLASAYALIPVLYGSLLVACLWSTKPRSLREVLLRVFVGAAVGLGISSALVFGSLMFLGSLRRGWLFVAEVGLVAVLGLGALIRTRRQWNGSPWVAPTDVPPRSATTRALAAGLCLVLCVGGAAFTYLSVTRPHGGHDAWAVWNLRARFLFKADTHWRDGFSQYLFWSHPDYPLLLPTNVARAWSYLGDETVVVPVTFAAVFTFGTVGLVIAAVGLLRGLGQGLLAGVLLLTAPSFVTHGASQYADVPLAFFVLAACVLLALRSAAAGGHRALSFMAGICAGCAAWTKNEGVLFFVAMTLSLLAFAVWHTGRTQSLRNLGYFILGALPLLTMIVYLKFGIAPKGDLVAVQSVETVTTNLGTLHRHLVVAPLFVRAVFKFGGPPIEVLTVLLFYALIVGIDVQARYVAPLRLILTALALVVGGFYVVYTTTHYDDVAGLIMGSLDRLVLQLWPTAVFVYALAIRTADAASTSIAGQTL